MTFQKVEKVLEIPSKQEKDETGGGQEEWGLEQRACSEQGCWCARTAHVGDTGSSHQSDAAAGGQRRPEL